MMTLVNTLRFLWRHPLNRGRRLSAVRRFLEWQVGSRLVPGPVAVPFVGGARLLVSRGMAGATGNIYNGLQEFEEMAFVLHGLRPEDVFIDVGANVGAFTVLAGAVVGARCFAFEPIPETFARLTENIRLNGIERMVDARNIGLGSSGSTMRFTRKYDAMNRVARPGDDPRDLVEVPVEPLDEAVGAVSASAVVVKIDVEGYERVVLEGMERLLSVPSPVAVLVESGDDVAACHFGGTAPHETLSRRGFGLFAYRPFEREIGPATETATGSGNRLYIRRVELFRERVAAAPPFHVNGKSV